MSEWIACSERMPPYGTEVIILARNPDRVTVSALEKTDVSGHHWRGCGWNGKPNYWMPLPAPPVSEEKT